MDLLDLGIAKRHRTLLGKKGISSCEDLLGYLPTRYMDCSDETPLEIGSFCVARVKVLSVENVPTHNIARPLKSFVMANCQKISTGENITVTWFNMPFIYEKAYCLIGDEVLLAGKVSLYEKFITLQITNPAIFDEKVEEAMKIYPVYSKINAVSNDWLCSTIQNALNCLSVAEPLPEDIIHKTGLISLDTAYRYLHSPASEAEIQKGRNRLLFNDLLEFALNNESLLRNSVVKSPFKITDFSLCKKILGTLPFSLTQDQSTTIKSMVSMARSGQRLNALVQGEVGSGKTLVAQLLSACFAEQYQVALMAPTQILAAQHYKSFSEMFTPFGISVDILDSTLTEKEKQNTLRKIASGETRIIIGTHSLLSDSVHYKNLALAIIDEEQRFGVVQREELSRKGLDGVHTVSLSGTPVPRTMAKAIYGEDTQLFVIESMPSNRKPIITGIAKSKESIYTFLQKQIAAGHQAYVVCPMIDENEELDVVSVEAAYTEYRKNLPADILIESLSGQTSTEETEKIMQRFTDGSTQILISTTVIEVGINVPNATCMVIESPERFGLSQLHQLRGRVGRGTAQGFCILDYNSQTAESNARMKALCTEHSGAKLSEIDLQLRGAGDVVQGTRQSGTNKYLELALEYPKVYAKAREIARELLDRGPGCCPLLENLEETKEAM